jgi:3D-(3,5/4)-trihydroxycyclohexane-1,2-dione acylhydrolase (decyclizing)
MLPGDLATAVAERIPIVVVLVDNHGYASIGALSRSVGSRGFGTHYRARVDGALPVDDAAGTGPAGGPAPEPGVPLPDLAANAESLGARVIRCAGLEDVRAALAGARGADGPVVIHVEVDRYAGVPSYDGWWDVPVAAVSDDADVQAARAAYEAGRQAQRTYVTPATARAEAAR